MAGEVEESIVLGHSNKHHAGFLGHSYLGEWVNLGAMTTNSDLKNNYRPVRLHLSTGDLDTGQLKLGMMLGDHVKTGIGTLVSGGTTIGFASNVFGGEGLVSGCVPPFTWRSGTRDEVYRLDAALETARTVMSRRGLTLTDADSALFRTILAATHSHP